MKEPTMGEIYKLCRIVEPTWSVYPKESLSLFVGRDKDLSGAQVVLRWIKLLNNQKPKVRSMRQPVLFDQTLYTRRSDGPYDVYESGGSTLRVKVG